MKKSNKLIIGQARKLASLFNQESKQQDLAGFGVGKKCVIRTYSAGVHFGTVVSRDSQDIQLSKSRRIWSWEGAFTLSAVAQDGVKTAKLSIVTPEILLQQCIEIIPCSSRAISNLESIASHDPS